MARRLEELDVREVLALAIAVEEANASRFATLASLFEGYNPELCAFFHRLREEEDRHTALLNEQWRRRFGDEPRPQIGEDDVDEVVEAIDVEHGEHAIFDDLDREAALKLAERSEQRARRLYMEAAARCADPGLKALYLDLAAMEEAHLGTLKELSRASDETGRSSGE